MLLYEASQFRLAYAQFVTLAEEGHGEAARVAVLMSRLGTQLYGSELPATPQQKAVWARTASRSQATLVAGAAN